VITKRNEKKIFEMLSFKFHETKDNKMFKKSLLALSIASTAFVANAGKLAVDVDETVAVDLVAAIGAADVNGCADAAAALGVTPVLGGNTPNNAGVNDTLTATPSATLGIFDETAASVTYTGNDACTVVAPDALVAASTTKNSLEGAQAKGVTLSVTQVAGIGGYTEEDTLTFTVTGGVVDETGSLGATLISLGPDGNTGGVDQLGTFTLLGVVGNKILFTVDTGYAGAARELLQLDGVVVTPDNGVTELSVESEVQNTANVKYDVTPGAKVTELAKQYSIMVDDTVVFDGIIDVAKDRVELVANDDDNTGAAEAVTNDTLIWEVKTNSTLGNLTPDVGTIVIKGDFDWMADLDTTGNGLSSTEILTGLTYTSDDTDNTFGGTANNSIDTAALNANMNELTLTMDDTTGTLDPFHRIVWSVPGKAGNATVVLAETSFSVSMDMDNDKATDTTTDTVSLNVGTDAAAGEWVLNGSVVTIPYVPFGPNTKVIMRHTNTGSQTGDLTIRYMLEDDSAPNSSDWSPSIVIGSSSKGVQDIRDAVINAVMADAGVTQGKVAVEITTNVPQKDVTVYAGYNVKNSADDRGFIGTFGKLGAAQSEE
jgi:hypothetical protein